LLGPEGTGLMALCMRVVEMTRTIAGLGINTSGVRQIAAAVGTGDQARIARTVMTLRRVAFYSGAVGALLMLALYRPVSWATFDDYKHLGAVALLALSAFFMDVSAGQGALIQGMRRIADLARMNLLGAFCGTVFSVVIVYFVRNEWGVVLSLACVSAMSILTSWWYARKVKVERVRVTFPQIRTEVSELVKLGSVIMSSTLATAVAAYLANEFVKKKLGAAALGNYNAAYTWGSQYVAIILTAMGADFYPRLTAAAKDNPECNRLVNEQTEVGLLMAGPGILGTLSLAPLVITLFYSSRYESAVDILRWVCLGMMLPVITWPMGYIVLAKGARKVYFWTEILSNASYAVLIWLGIKFFGLTGTGIAFVCCQVVHFMMVYVIARRMTGFRWSSANRRLILVFVPMTLAVFCAGLRLDRLPAALLGLAITLPVGIYSLRTLCHLVPLDRLPGLARKFIRLLRLAPPETRAVAIL